MATKKELVTELVSLGAVEDEIKDLKNAELETLLEQYQASSEGDVEPKADVEPEVQDEVVDEEEVSDTESTESTEEDKPVVQETDRSGEVVREISHQLGIFSDYIYNVLNKGADVVIENLGYGDIHYSTEGLAIVGKAERLLFQESVRLSGVSAVYFIASSQPVVQIIEVK